VNQTLAIQTQSLAFDLRVPRFLDEEQFWNMVSFRQACMN